ncbi:hypothetical protein [Halorussus marinus]|uniref:hypothetical protein n=1 Tax=Halorussus marinus TaxID=2505976 RepID=UPI0010931BA5|nr:hypothetical protein [Halorussus marinus]
MTFNETHFDFDDEVDRLEDRIQELTEALADIDDDSPQAQQLASQKQELAAQKKGVLWARGFPEDDDREGAFESDDFPMWDEDVDGVTLGAVRANVYGNIQNDLESDPNAGGGTSATLLVAEGTVEAPYIDDSMTDAQHAGVVGQLHPFYRKWAEARISELLDPEVGNGRYSATSPAE